MENAHSAEVKRGDSPRASFEDSTRVANNHSPGDEETRGLSPPIRIPSLEKKGLGIVDVNVLYRSRGLGGRDRRPPEAD
jgi:hypothetical protein